MEREELVFKHFSPETYRKFKSFYYEDFLFISGKDFSELFRFFKKLLLEIQTGVKINDEIRKIIGEIESVRI